MLRSELMAAVKAGSPAYARRTFARYEKACAGAEVPSYYRHRSADFVNIDGLIATAANRESRKLHLPAKRKLPGLGRDEPSADAVQALLAMADLMGINCSLQRKEAFLELMAKVFAQDDM